MLSFDDPRWPGLEGGYRVPYDARPALSRLSTGEDVERTWEELWQELHHQGDVGMASYVAVAHLVRIHRARGVQDWNTYALVATIETERHEERNPRMPAWVRQDYDPAWKQLVQLGLDDLQRSSSPELAASILAVIARDQGLPQHSRLLLNYREDEVADMIKAYAGS